MKSDVYNKHLGVLSLSTFVYVNSTMSGYFFQIFRASLTFQEVTSLAGQKLLSFLTSAKQNCQQMLLESRQLSVIVLFLLLLLFLFFRN